MPADPSFSLCSQVSSHQKHLCSPLRPMGLLTACHCPQDSVTGEALVPLKHHGNHSV